MPRPEGEPRASLNIQPFSRDGVNIINPVLNQAWINHVGGYKANKMRKGVAEKERVEVRIRTQQKEIKHFKIDSRS